jgi:hypothetical protein
LKRTNIKNVSHGVGQVESGVGVDGGLPESAGIDEPMVLEILKTKFRPEFTDLTPTKINSMYKNMLFGAR